ncbi:hypothetical protein E308F_30710 [Moorella sp. E308F]|uniref:hypothetical protein n=1 Tax=Moorella sp. E308F TaxID=2572682 RepID=UPI0010FFAFAA|nr:hypothetical protein [Moorella sp. E308F]GEA16825.1 hypothetical protein E308F_30710 [Moorella sp. E308F]
MIDWKRKLSSRKFWALLAGLATSILVLTNANNDTITKVVAVITATGSVVGYMFSEAYVDGKAVDEANNNPTAVVNINSEKPL